MSIHLAVDIGGTFTDVVAREGESTAATKVPTTPDDLVRGVRNGIDAILERTAGDRPDVERFAHGTTAGTNAVLEREGGTVGLLMTEGFRDVLAIGRQKRREMYDLFLDPQTPTFLAPRERRFGIGERVDPEGDVLTPLDEDGVVEAIDALVEDHDVDAVGVCYLFSFANPEHERRTHEIIEDRHPEVHVSLSSAISPKFREYERLVVTAFDAYLRPVIRDYVARMEGALDGEGIDAELQVMQSRGGITNADNILDRPVGTLLSGPAAGVTGAADVGSRAGYPDLVTLDMGGTSCDVSLVDGGSPHISSEGEIVGYPLRMQMVDISTIGSGGGSIAWIDEAGSLHVGPESAGADPGPACYGRGGTDPTVTDASLVLGYLDPSFFAGGSFDLDPGLARESIREGVAGPLGYDLVEAAKGVHNIVNTRIAEQLRLATVKRGFDPREFGLFAMGGAGPVQAGRLAADLGIPRVVVPRTPGVLSANGLLSADVEHDHETTFARALDGIDPDDLEAAYADLAERGEETMAAEGVSLDEVVVTRQADMRYQGQSYEIELEVPGSLSTEAFGTIEDRFHGKHEQVYGHKNEDDPVEFVNLRVVHTFTPEKIVARPDPGEGSVEDARKGTREMHFVGHERPFDVPVYSRAGLPFDVTTDGPAVVEQRDTTTVVYPEQECAVDEHGNLVIRT